MKDYEIKIDRERAIDEYGDDVFDMSIKNFIKTSYQENKEKLKLAVENRDEKQLKLITHTLKTNVRYMCNENFATECEEIEKHTKAPADWDKILSQYPTFMEHFDILYTEVKKIYDTMETEAEPEEVSPKANSQGSFNRPTLRKEKSVTGLLDSKRASINLGNQPSKKAGSIMSELRRKENPEPAMFSYVPSPITNLPLTQNTLNSNYKLIFLGYFDNDEIRAVITRRDAFNILKEKVSNFIENGYKEAIKTFERGFKNKIKDDIVKALIELNKTSK